MSTPKPKDSLIPESLAQLYRRMAKAFRSPPPLDSVAIAKLSRVVELHHRAVAAIEAAIEISNVDGRERLQELREPQLEESPSSLVLRPLLFVANPRRYFQHRLRCRSSIRNRSPARAG